MGEVWIFSGNNNSHLAILPDECCTQFTVVSIQSRFDESCFDTNRSHFDTANFSQFNTTSIYRL